VLRETREEGDVRVQLDLARAVDDEVVVGVRPKLVVQPVEVIQEVSAACKLVRPDITYSKQ
jgi:hypothetical protein